MGPTRLLRIIPLQLWRLGHIELELSGCWEMRSLTVGIDLHAPERQGPFLAFFLAVLENHRQR